MKRALTATSVLLLLAACATSRTQPTLTSSPSVEPQSILTEDQAATLRSLRLVDDHPLYIMRYVGPYEKQAAAVNTADVFQNPVGVARDSCQPAWGCSLFASLGDDQNRLFGRNFDWRFSPALLLFTNPPDGYASISMVDIEYLGFEGSKSDGLEDLPLEERRSLLEAPFLPFDGMNEKGLAIAMAAVPAQEMPRDHKKETIDHLEVIREILDHAGTVSEAVEILGGYNIDMGTIPLHYLIASRQGDSALVEFYEGEMVVFRNEAPWLAATNFLLAATGGDPKGECARYDRMQRRLDELEGRVSSKDAFALLADVSQDITQWSVVYHMTSGDLEVVMDRDYSGDGHSFSIFH